MGDFRSSVEDLKGDVGRLALSEPIMAVGDALGKAGQTATDLYESGKSAVRRAVGGSSAKQPEKLTKDIPLPAARKRRAVSRSLGAKR